MKPKKLQTKQAPGKPVKQNTKRAVKRATQAGRAVKAAEVLGTATGVATLPRVPSRWRWHHRTLLSLQSRLLQDRGERLRSAAEPLEPHSIDEADSATDEFDHDLALTQLSSGQDALYEVNEALKRILNGTYGVCEETGNVIPSARLKAIPWTRFSIEVENRLEKKGAATQRGVPKAATVRGGSRVYFAPEEEPEESEEKPPAPAKDEALSVFSPPAPHVPPPPTPERPIRAGKRKGRH